MGIRKKNKFDVVNSQCNYKLSTEESSIFESYQDKYFHVVRDISFPLHRHSLSGRLCAGDGRSVDCAVVRQ